MPLRVPKLSIGKRALLFVGKARRWALHTFDGDYIRKSHKRRTGECARCGACCKLGIKCPSLKADEAQGTKCTKHVVRTRNCVVFPIDETDIRDRNIIKPDTPCGYSFNGKNGKVRDHVAKWIFTTGIGKLFISRNGNKKENR